MPFATKRVIVVTGCDSNHFWLAQGLIDSLQAIPDRQFDIGFAQVGQTAPSAAILDGVDVVKVIDSNSFKLAEGEGFQLAALAVKSRLPELFPGYDIYVWLDGDIWVQNAVGIEDVIRHVDHADICINPQIDPNYYSCAYPDHYTIQVYTGLFGEETMRRMVCHPMVNSGVFAARASSPLWHKWTDLLFRLRNQIADRPVRFFSDQIPLHYLLFSGALTLEPLRAVNNWLVSHSRLAFNSSTGKLLTPSHPYEEINIVHLIGPSKEQTITISDQVFKMTYQDMQAFSRAISAGHDATVVGTPMLLARANG